MVAWGGGRPARLRALQLHPQIRVHMNDSTQVLTPETVLLPGEGWHGEHTQNKKDRTSIWTHGDFFWSVCHGVWKWEGLTDAADSAPPSLYAYIYRFFYIICTYWILQPPPLLFTMNTCELHQDFSEAEDNELYEEHIGLDWNVNVWCSDWFFKKNEIKCVQTDGPQTRCSWLFLHVITSVLNNQSVKHFMNIHRLQFEVSVGHQQEFGVLNEIWIDYLN